MRKELRSTLATMCLAICGVQLQAAQADTSARNSIPTITAVSGQSWLNHLHRPFGDSSMGKTGQLGPPASEPGQGARWQLGLLNSSGKNTTLRGQDLYRLNCQGCHGETGLGAPPEIHSVIDPVRATSVPLMMERMKQRGMDIGRGTATEMAKQAGDALVERLHNGGQDMPAFSQLNDGEVRTVLEYLKQLSGVPGAKQLAVNESPERVGEFIAKSTCHVCHDATGPNPTSQQLENGEIPPLDTMTGRVDESEFVRKVTSGAPIVMGTPPSPHRGRMPVFSYLTREEAADVYLYLSSYPPSTLEAAVPVVASTQQDGGGPGVPPAGPTSPPPLQDAGAASDPALPTPMPDWVPFVSLMALGAFALTLLVAGLAFAAYELRRLGNEAERRNIPLTKVQPINVRANKNSAVKRSIGELIAG
jgi:mono/diheme cytochrome c family protein